jgi:hypothetical protein
MASAVAVLARKPAALMPPGRDVLLFLAFICLLFRFHCHS